MIDAGLGFIMILACVPLFIYWGVSYAFVCRDVGRYVLDMIGWRG